MSEMPVAIVTGAGSGIGRETARMLTDEGYRVALVGRTPATLEETGSMLPGLEGQGWVAIQADMGVGVEAEGIIDATLKVFGRVDALVNNAGFVDLKPVARHDAGLIDTLFAVNAVGPIRAIVRVLKEFDAQKSGVIVNVSTMGTRDPFPGLGVYGSAKAALETIARAVATEHKRTNVRAYCIGPGAVETGMLRGMFNEKMIPKNKALAPSVIAEKIVACVTGKTEMKNGETAFVASP